MTGKSLTSPLTSESSKSTVSLTSVDQGYTLENLDIRYLVGEPTDDGPIIAFCPAPDHSDTLRPNLAIYADGTYCFRCGFQESRKEFIQRIEASPQSLRKAESSSKSKTVTGRVSPSYLSAISEAYYQILTQGAREHRREYLYRRGIPLSTIREQKLGHTGTKFAIPVWSQDKDKKIVGLHFRRDDEYLTENYPKYTNIKGGGVHFYRPGRSGPTVVVEGPFDALLLSQYGYNAITTTGGAQSIFKFCRGAVPWYEPFYVATDVGEEQNKVRQQFTEAFDNAVEVFWPGASKDLDLGSWILTIPIMERSEALRQLLDI